MKNILVSVFNENKIEKDNFVRDLLYEEYGDPNDDRKFLDMIKIKDYEIMTDTGWEKIYSIGKTIPYVEWFLKTENFELKCADKHIVFGENFCTRYVEDLNVGDKIQTERGLEKIIKIEKTNKESNMFDLQLTNSSNKRYYTNGILSHNSMFMQNMAVKTADQGANIVYITLEMGSQKCMKRMGSMRLKIKSSEYDDKAKDTIFMKNKINGLKNMNGGMFNSTPGKIFVKKYNTVDCTVTDIDNYITKIEKTKGIKINLVFVDYLNLMALEKGLDFSNMLFLKGKHFAEGLRYVADKHNVAIITSTQTDKAVWGSNDIELKNIPESKAVAETADSVFAIIRNPEMKKNNIYRLKILKLRDGEHNNEQVRFDFNPDFLTMENDEFVGTV